MLNKLLFGDCKETNVFRMFNEFIKEFVKSIPSATLQRKKRAVIQPHDEQNCSVRYLRQFKVANAVGRSTKKILVIAVTKAQSLIELFAGRNLKYVSSPAVAERWKPKPWRRCKDTAKRVSMENLAQSPTDGSNIAGTSTQASRV